MAAVAGGMVAGAALKAVGQMASAKIAAKAQEAIAERQQQTQLTQIFGQLYGGLAIPQDAVLTPEAMETIAAYRQFEAQQKAATMRSQMITPIQTAGVSALGSVAGQQIAAAPQANPGGVFNLRFA